MKRKKAGLFDPYLDTMGGGEKHILSILHVLAEKGYDVDIFWDEDKTADIKKRFSLSIPHLTFRDNIFTTTMPFITKQGILSEYDAFFYVPDGSYFVSAAKQTFVFCMVPQQDIYPHTVVSKLKTLPFTFLSNARYTQHWLQKWGIPSEVVYPFLDTPYIHIDSPSLVKNNQILSVGRFFGHLHSKQHIKIIDAFTHLKKKHPQFEDYTLILAGGVRDEDAAYFVELQKRAARDNSIILKPNLSFEQLFDLYKSSRFYWHFTGYKTDTEAHPERAEHLGITPLEAMACGCITMAYNAGGPREIITHDKNGYLFTHEPELFEYMKTLHDNDTKQYHMAVQAKRYITDHFSYKQFSKRVEDIIL